MRRHEVSRAHKTKTLRAVTKLKGKGINGTGACQLTRAQQALHRIKTKSPFCVILKNIPPVLTFTTAHIRDMRGTRTYCSSACPLSYAQGNRHLLHTITAMEICASPSRLTYAAENSRKHHQTLDIHALTLAEQNLGESVMAISPSTPQRLRLFEYLEALLPMECVQEISLCLEPALNRRSPR